MSRLEKDRSDNSSGSAKGSGGPIYVILALAGAAVVFGLSRVIAGNLSLGGLWPLLPLYAGLGLFLAHFVSGRSHSVLMMAGMGLAALGIIGIAILWLGQPVDYIGGMWPVVLVVLVVGALVAFFLFRKSSGSK